MNYKFVKADKTHLETVAQLWSKLMSAHKEMDQPFFSETEQNIESYKDHLDSFIGGDDSLLLLFLHDDQIKGYLTASINYGFGYGNYNSLHFCEIGDIMIESDFRGRRFGELMLNEVKNWAKEHNVNRIELKVFSQNHSAYKFFLRTGFKDLFNHLYMEF